jgi:hypothetical protein
LHLVDQILAVLVRLRRKFFVFYAVKTFTKFLVVLYAGAMSLLVQSEALDGAPYKLSGDVAKLAGITF